MRWKLLLFALLAFMIFPVSAGAVDFSISDVQINAHLQPDGTVQVNEQHTYEFDGKFKGIIREMKPKEGAKIEGFEAFENGKKLKVEKKNDEYRAYRKGKNETITVELQYTIKSGMEKYEDGAQFYWPFFDERNETDYGNMTITVIPPSQANDVLFLGYDSAEETGAVQEDGSVKFAMGEVYSGENGDIRVVYESSLFPQMTVIDRKIRPSVRADQQLQAIEKAQFIANQQRVEKIGGVVLGAGSLLVILISVFARIRKKRFIHEADLQIATNGFYVPTYDMSLPAILLFKKGNAAVELMSAALLDLVRKGYVRQLSDDEFELVNPHFELEHEQQLAQLLFFQIGKNERFTLEQLKTYTKEEKNYAEFQKSFVMWQQLLKSEVKQYQLKKPSIKTRVALVLIGLTGITLSILFILYELYFLLTVAIVLSLYSLIFSLFYRPLNYAGTLMLQEWKEVEHWMNEMDPKKWDDLSLDERFRVLVYGVGIQHKELASYYEEFASAQKSINQNRSSDYTESGSGGFYVHNPVFLTGSFSQASTNVSANAPSDSSSSSSGGTGGGGGGSGAF
ncbi:DUF2207 domain-containing protein [Sporosarcina obsidiansis]|uniref:DUF2207 domain-containing protein n=1 Tax=Sporosarcina obsidiansis TaxID=2660748 RepID=UPI00129BFFAA|nr:DUF2207 domain-containing protein [Sporosarcina obsidiansis]